MDNFDKKTGCGRPPRHMYFKNFYGSPDYKKTNLHYRKMFLTQNIIQDILNMFYILSEKNPILLAVGGVEPPP